MSQQLKPDKQLALHAQQVLESAELVFCAEQIQQAVAQLAAEINQRLQGVGEPVIALPIMNGGLVLGGQLITRLSFPVLVDYLHATRYRDQLHGKELVWKVKPQQSLKDRTLLLIDDIFDEGFTLEAVIDYCRAEGARRIYSVVLLEKQHPRPRAGLKTDFCALRVEDRYVFGFGMDYKGFHRNLDSIYAVCEESL